MKNHKLAIKRKLQHYTRSQIKFSTHAEIRMIHRQIDKEEVIKNIINPNRLEYAIKEEKEKYSCYFGYSKNLCHKYVLILKQNIIIVTIMKINRRWQKIIDKKLQ